MPIAILAARDVINMHSVQPRNWQPNASTYYNVDFFLLDALFNWFEEKVP